jgi:hypothetical protein
MYTVRDFRNIIMSLEFSKELSPNIFETAGMNETLDKTKHLRECMDERKDTIGGAN